MENEIIEKLILAKFPHAHVEVRGDGYHFEAIVVAKEFEGVRKVKQQQMVYEALQAPIASGDLHAISLKTLTPEEWSTKQYG